jgi:hypothetical protein
MRKRWRLIGAALLGVLIILVANGRIFYIDFPYRGKIIDKETKRPIEGAAVVAVWWMESPAPHPIITYYDAYEIVTDVEGNFTTPWVWGGSINPLPKLRPPNFTIFKPGYEAYRARRFTSQINPASRWWRSVVELHHLTTRKERLRNLSFHPGSGVPDEKIPNLIRLRNIERKHLGLDR